MKTSIQSRRDALYAYYDLPEEAYKKVEELFARIEQFAETCTDQADFEIKLATSVLNEEYNELFARFACYVKKPEGTVTEAGQVKTMLESQTKSVLKSQTSNRLKGAIINALPDSISKWFIYGIYNLPIVGDIASAINTGHTARRFFGKKENEKKPPKAPPKEVNTQA